MHYHFTWGMLIKAPYLGWIIEGISVTCELALVAWCIGLLLGTVVGVLRVTEHPFLRLVGSAYVELFRNIPLMVQLFLWLYVVPELLPLHIRNWWNRLDGVSFWTAVIGISFYTSARIAEQIRSAINSIPRGQFHAALSTGLSPVQMYRYIIVPYSLRIMIPALTSEFLTVFKNTALALTIGVTEITATSQKIEAWSFKGIEAYSMASFTYIITTLLVVVFMTWIERRAYIPGLIRRGG